ncbi:MAG: helix-turn-helix domain-containing protein [Eubacterium sp.]|nr:helix-turn-helix domain-containing protein [Eubacterium sp.]
MIISERIFALMQEKGISQKELSDKTGISQSTISDWKRKKTNPSADKLKVICDVLRVTLYELLADTGEESSRPVDYVIVDKESEDYLLLMEYHELPGAFRARLAGYLDALRDLAGEYGRNSS